MGKKYVIIILVLVFAMLSTMCLAADNGPSPANTESKTQREVGQYDASITPNVMDNRHPVSYKIITDTYIENDARNNISINYPQIIIQDDNDRQLKINELLKMEALQYATTPRDDNRHFTLTLNYKITWWSERLLSVQYNGIGYVQDEPHPNAYFYTTNINISSGSKLRLRDIVNIDEDFVTKYRDEKLKSIRTSRIDGRKVFVTNFGIESNTLGDTMELFKKADLLYPKSWGVYFYFTPESLGISASVSHAAGNHVEFEIDYKDIADNAKAENEVWKDFFPNMGKDRK